ncbi:hypothetical protein CEP51_005150 [Fusarium floridanum]|uniref:Uncharacterized protein n=1 Tax=Fusarium floridanum TaxID=1325733 RepID=A0A428RY06_9HYPO|nr:hypothetical protein CEP51_005150 [Fusarium floridanum]
MGAIEKEKASGSPSSRTTSDSNNPDRAPGAGGVSDLTSQASQPPTETDHAPDQEAAKWVPESANPSKDGGPKACGSRHKELKMHDLQVDDDSDSDGSIDAALSNRVMLETFAGYVNSQSIYNLHKKNLEKKHKNKQGVDQGSNLVKSLVDYLRVIENRIDDLDINKESKGNNGNKRKGFATQHSDCTVELAVKFFRSAAYLEENGSFPKIVDEPDKGTFMSSHDDQNLIRVLYSTLRENASKPQISADADPPKASDIDIVSFGISSEAISLFFAKRLHIGTKDSHLIRFGKPFRPLIRSLDRVRDQLQELEDKYGQVRTREETFLAPGNLYSEVSHAQESHEENDALPFAKVSGSDDDALEAFDRPSALPHFQTLVAFVNEYLGEQIQLYERLRTGQEQHIAFENLWMLFDVGDTIYCPLREAGTEEYFNEEGPGHTPIQRHTPQAYRVVATNGGMPFERVMAPSSKMRGKDKSVAIAGTGTQTGAEAIANILTHSAQLSSNVRDNYTEFNVYCFYLDFNGVEYGSVREVFVFRPYEREMEIRALQAYPDRYMIEDQLRQRGEMFLDVTRISHMQYEGLTINSAVVVDMKVAFEDGSNEESGPIQVPKFTSPTSLWLANAEMGAYDLFGKPTCSHLWCYHRNCTSDVYIESQKRKRFTIESRIKLILEEYDNEKKRGSEGLGRIKKLMEDNDIIRLLPGAVPGFVLRSRKWVLLDLLQLGPVDQDNEWRHLVLPPGHRQLVQAMVETHTQKLGSNMDSKIGIDLVRGKECVAAHTKKPLYPITCGDIGYRPEDVERNLGHHFRLAHKWGCVLLLDEADVFLAKRDQKDVQRNGLVSVFLRILEYYSGILFLTTNRVGAIDDAFRSRLHLTLYYPKLTKKQTKEIFKHNLERIADINANRKLNGLPPFEYKDTESKIIDWAMETWKVLRWNGRQIRNAFQTVLALAEFHEKGRGDESSPRVVTRKYFKIVANASTQFNDYLLATHGMDEDKVANREFMRALSYSPSSKLVFRGFNQGSSDSSSEEEEDDDGSSETVSDSDEFDESEMGKKKSRGKKGKSSSKKSKKSAGKRGKSGKKLKENDKEVKDSDKSDDSD